MAHHRTGFNHKRQKPRTSQAAAPRPAPVVHVKKEPIQYGKAVIILENVQKETFEYKSGTWAPYTMTIAECRVECEVKELPQKVNGMSRYEVRSPLPSSS